MCSSANARSREDVTAESEGSKTRDVWSSAPAWCVSTVSSRYSGSPLLDLRGKGVQRTEDESGGDLPAV